MCHTRRPSSLCCSLIAVCLVVWPLTLFVSPTIRHGIVQRILSRVGTSTNSACESSCLAQKLVAQSDDDHGGLSASLSRGEAARWLLTVRLLLGIILVLKILVALMVLLLLNIHHLWSDAFSGRGDGWASGVTIDDEPFVRTLRCGGASLAQHAGLRCRSRTSCWRRGLLHRNLKRTIEA